MQIKISGTFKRRDVEAVIDVTVEIAPADVVAIARAAMADDEPADDTEAPDDQPENAGTVSAGGVVITP